MPNKLSELYNAAENIKGKKLVFVLIGILVVFTVLGIVLGNAIPENLNGDETVASNDGTDLEVTQSKQFEGKVVYIDPRFYPLEDISFYLEDSSGNELILLNAHDEKLTVVEGLEVIVFGTTSKSMDEPEKEVLLVDRIIVKNQ